MSEHHINRKAVASVPDIAFIPFDAMAPQKRTEFVRESNLSVMFLLT